MKVTYENFNMNSENRGLASKEGLDNNEKFSINILNSREFLFNYSKYIKREIHRVAREMDAVAFVHRVLVEDILNSSVEGMLLDSEDPEWFLSKDLKSKTIKAIYRTFSRLKQEAFNNLDYTSDGEDIDWLNQEKFSKMNEMEERIDGYTGSKSAEFADKNDIIDLRQEKEELELAEYLKKLKDFLAVIKSILVNHIVSDEDCFAYQYFIDRYVLGKGTAELKKEIYYTEFKRPVTSLSYIDDRFADSFKGYFGESFSIRELVFIFKQLLPSIFNEIKRGDLDAREKSSEDIFEEIKIPGELNIHQQSQAEKYMAEALSSFERESFRLRPLRTKEEGKNYRRELIANIISLFHKYVAEEEVPFKLRDYQKAKDLKILEKLLAQEEPRMVADIAATNAGKSVMIGAIIKCAIDCGCNVVLATSSNTIYLGPEGLEKTLADMIGAENIGPCFGKRQVLGKPLSLMSHSGFRDMEKLMAVCVESRPYMFIIDEVDLFRSSLSQAAIRNVTDYQGFPIVIGLSATKTTTVGSVEEFADISDELKTRELIEMGFSKHVLGFYVSVNISLTEEDFQGEEVQFEKLSYMYRRPFIDIPVKIHLENHRDKPALFFTYTVEQAKAIHKQLSENGVKSQVIHGYVTRRQQDRILKDFMEGRTTSLIAANIIDRGLNLPVAEVGYFCKLFGPQNSALTHELGRLLRTNHNTNLAIAYQLLPEKSCKPLQLIEDVLDYNEEDRANDPFKDKKFRNPREASNIYENYLHYGYFYAAFAPRVEQEGYGVKYKASYEIKEGFSTLIKQRESAMPRTEAECRTLVLGALEEKGIYNRYELIYFPKRDFNEISFGALGNACQMISMLCGCKDINRPSRRELAKKLYGPEGENEMRDYILDILQRKGYADRYEILFQICKFSKEKSFSIFGSAHILLGETLHRRISSISSEILEEFCDYVFGPETEVEKKAKVLSVLNKEKGIKDRYDLILLTLENFIRGRYPPFGGGEVLSNFILGTYGNEAYNQEAFQRVIGYLFGEERTEELEERLRGMLERQGIKDRYDLRSITRRDRRENASLRKCFLDIGKLVSIRINPISVFLAAVEQKIFGQETEEEFKAKLREVFAVQGIDNWEELSKFPPAEFQKLRFGHFGKAMTLYNKLFNRRVTEFFPSHLKILGDYIFGREAAKAIKSKEYKATLEEARAVLVVLGIHNREDLLSVSIRWLRRQNFGKFGGVKHFITQVLPEGTNYEPSREILERLADTLYPKGSSGSVLNRLKMLI